MTETPRTAFVVKATWLGLPAQWFWECPTCERAFGALTLREATAEWEARQHDTEFHAPLGATRAAKAAIDAGVAERLVRLAEREVDVLVEVIRASFLEMGLELTPDRVAIVGKHMRAIGGRVAS